MKVPADKLRSVLGITNVNFVRGKHTLAVVDSTLQEGSMEAMPAKQEMNP
jgi:hypothetical protein